MIKKYTEEEDAMLLANILSYAEIANRTGRSLYALRMRKSTLLNREKTMEVRNRARAKYISKNNAGNDRNIHNYWSSDQVEMIMVPEVTVTDKKLHRMTDAELSSILGRTISAIEMKRCRVIREMEKLV